MICGKVVYLQELVCLWLLWIAPNIKNPAVCPEEYLVQICKQVLIDRERLLCLEETK